MKEVTELISFIAENAPRVWLEMNSTTARRSLFWKDDNDKRIWTCDMGTRGPRNTCLGYPVIINEAAVGIEIHQQLGNGAKLVVSDTQETTSDEWRVEGSSVDAKTGIVGEPPKEGDLVVCSDDGLVWYSDKVYRYLCVDSYSSNIPIHVVCLPIKEGVIRARQQYTYIYVRLATQTEARDYNQKG